MVDVRLGILSINIFVIMKTYQALSQSIISTVPLDDYGIMIKDTYAQVDLVYETLSHKAERIHEIVKGYPEIQEEEKRQWLIGYIKFMKDVILPFSNIRILLRWKQLSVMFGQPLPEEIEQDFQALAQWIRLGGMKRSTDRMLATHPYYDQLIYMNRNYEHKRRREIINKRRKSWIEHFNNPTPTLPNLVSES